MVIIKVNNHIIMLKKKISTSFLVGVMALVGLGSGVAIMASAQSAATVTTPVVTPANTTVKAQTVDTPEVGDVADATESPKTHGHAPLGGDGVVSSISGTTIIVSEEANEGGASYTINASKATVTNNGVAGSLSDIKVGSKIFVEGTTTGTNVVATSISLGHKGEHADKAGDSDGGAASEASEPAGSSDIGE
jgi:hypothetical protein